MCDLLRWQYDKYKLERFLLKRANQVKILIFVGGPVCLFYSFTEFIGLTEGWGSKFDKIEEKKKRK